MSSRPERSRTSPLAFARPSIGDEEISAVVDVLRSGWLTTGPRTAEFEAAFAASVGAPAALALNSGTAALHLALLAMGVGPGDTVVTTPLTFCSTAHVIEHVGATPLLVDVDPESLNIDPGLIEAAAHAARSPVKAIIPVHFAGAPVDLDPVLRSARSLGAGVVEDAAHAQGASYGDRMIGDVTAGGVPRAVCFSFYATKNITTGEGGMLTGDTGLVDEARRWSLHGMSRDAWSRYDAGGRWRYDVDRTGFKYNLGDIQSALGLVQLRRSVELLDRRRHIAEAYDAAFADLEAIISPAHVPGHAWHLYVVRLDPSKTSLTRNDLIAGLNERGIGTSVHFIPIHRLGYYAEKYADSLGPLPVADEAFERIVSLPIYPAMTDDDVAAVIDAVHDVTRRDC